MYFLTTYDLVSRGKNVSEINQCWGTYDSNAKIGYGPAYQNTCIHSGLIKTSGDISTTWYNFTLASAGTIIDENTSSSSPAANIDPATESICPKGWTLPSRAQIQTVGSGSGSTIYVSSFLPVFGGSYNNSALISEDTNGAWWSSNAYDSATRHYLQYTNNALFTAYRGGRFRGYYIRCVAKQKTITDLAYMQDVTDEVIVTRKFLVAGNFVV